MQNFQYLTRPQFEAYIESVPASVEAALDLSLLRQCLAQYRPGKEQISVCTLTDQHGGTVYLVAEGDMAGVYPIPAWFHYWPQKVAYQLDIEQGAGVTFGDLQRACQAIALT